DTTRRIRLVVAAKHGPRRLRTGDLCGDPTTAASRLADMVLPTVRTWALRRPGACQPDPRHPPAITTTFETPYPQRWHVGTKPLTVTTKASHARKELINDGRAATGNAVSRAGR